MSNTVIPTSTVKALKKIGSISEASFGSRFRGRARFDKLWLHILPVPGRMAAMATLPQTYRLHMNCPSNPRYSDGRSEVKIARSSNSALGLRIASLLEQVGGISSSKLREHVLKKFATVFLQQHPEVEQMRVSLWQVTPPTMEEYTQGKRHVPTALCTYDCNQAAKPLSPKHE